MHLDLRPTVMRPAMAEDDGRFLRKKAVKIYSRPTTAHPGPQRISRNRSRDKRRIIQRISKDRQLAGTGPTNEPARGPAQDRQWQRKQQWQENHL